MRISKSNFLISTQYFKDILWQASGNTIAQIIGILGIPILTRLFSPEDFAIQALFLQLSGFLAGILAYRFDYLIVIPKYNFHANLFRLFIFFAGLCSVILLIFILFFLGTFTNLLLPFKSLNSWIYLTPFASFIIMLSVTQQHFAQRSNNFRDSGISEIIGKIMYVFVGIIGGVLGFGVIILLIIIPISAWSKFIWLNYKYPIFKENIILSKVNFFNLIRYATRVSLRNIKLAHAHVYSHILLACTSILPLIIIEQEFGLNVLGQYSLVILTLSLPVSLISISIGKVYFQRASYSWSQGRKFDQYWISSFRGLILMGIPIFLFVSLISPILYPLIFGDSWVIAGEIAQILAISSFFAFLSTPFDQTAIVVRKPLYPILWHSFRAISMILVALFVIDSSLSLKAVIIIFAFVQSIAFLVDLFVSRYFSKHS